MKYFKATEKYVDEVEPTLKLYRAQRLINADVVEVVATDMGQAAFLVTVRGGDVTTMTEISFGEAKAETQADWLDEYASIRRSLTNEAGDNHR